MRRIFTHFVSCFKKRGPEERLCVLCKYHHLERDKLKNPSTSTHRCLLFKGPMHDPVTGETIYRYPRRLECRDVRVPRGLYGPLGKHWVLKTEEGDEG
jgi:hypothetical protein